MTRRLIAATVVLFVACGPPRHQIAAGAQAAQASPLPTGTLGRIARADCALSGPAARADADERDRPRESHGARQVAEGQPEAERHAAAGRRGQGRVRAELRGVGALPSSRREDGGPDRVDDASWGRRSRPIEARSLPASRSCRQQAKNVGTLKSSPQQEVETKTTSAGQEVIVIEPTNPQIVYVPQYNTAGGLHAGSDDTWSSSRKTTTLTRRSRPA